MKYSKLVIVCAMVVLTAGGGCSRKYRLTAERMAQQSAYPFHRGGLKARGAVPGGQFNGRLNILWENKINDKLAGPLTLHHGTLVYSGVKDRIRFYNKLNGSYLGRRRVKGSAQTGVVFKDSLAFYCTSPNRNRLVCVDMLRRKSIWTYPVKDAVGGSIIVDNRLIVGSSEGVLTALDVQNGELLWSVETAGRFAAAPAYDAGRIFQPGDDGVLYAIAVDNGNEIYRVELEGPLLGTAAVSDLVLAADMSGYVYGIDPDSGHIIWQTRLENDIWSAPAVSDSHLIIGTSGGGVVALEVATGNVLWRFNATEVVRASVTIAGEFVIVGTMGGKLYSLDVADGRLISQRQLKGAITCAPVSDGDRVYV
ncbi:MAG: PQQ-binding-like beta-propeller repeat protein, partial [candidate division Zixibacteria bacterium]|nr:PQQ-binding-like beta-propeller repeat protein [candidate division Zixibacteria bacterium]